MGVFENGLVIPSCPPKLASTMGKIISPIFTVGNLHDFFFTVFFLYPKKQGNIIIVGYVIFSHDCWVFSPIALGYPQVNQQLEPWTIKFNDWSQWWFSTVFCMFIRGYIVFFFNHMFSIAFCLLSQWSFSIAIISCINKYIYIYMHIFIIFYIPASVDLFKASALTGTTC